MHSNILEKSVSVVGTLWLCTSITNPKLLIKQIRAVTSRPSGGLNRGTFVFHCMALQHLHCIG